MRRGSVPSLLAVVACVAGCPRPPGPDAAVRDVPRADAAAGDALAVLRPGADPCEILMPEQRDLVVAQVNDRRLTLCDFTRRINVENPYLRARMSTPDQRRALLQSWLDAELLAAEAQARGYDQHPEVRRAVNLQLARRLEQTLRAEVTVTPVSDADVAAYYEAHRAEYNTEAQVRVSHIVLGSQAEAERTLAELRAQPQDNALWTRLVRERSTHRESREREGDLGFFAREGSASVPAEVAAAAFTLEQVGALSERVVPSAHGGPSNGPGFHVLRLTARREALHRTLAEESARIRARLERQRREQAEDAAVNAVLTRLRGASRVEIDEAALSRLQVNAPAPAAPEVRR
ncbi:MAG: peptidyl-prolyl cis-trans isomerase [Polyangiales bacterium]